MWLDEMGVRVLDHYSPKSPDFNPIKRVWSWMVQYIKKEMPTDKATLTAAIHRAWSALPQTIIKAYIDGLPNRITAVYNNGAARLD